MERCGKCRCALWPDRNTLRREEEFFCDDYCAGTKKWCSDFVREVLLEDEVPRSAFFAPITTVMKFAAE